MKLLGVIFTITAHTCVLECRWLFLYFYLRYKYFTYMFRKRNTEGSKYSFCGLVLIIQISNLLNRVYVLNFKHASCVTGNFL